MVPNFFGKDRIHRKRAIWFQMKPDSPYYVLSGSKNLALFLALLRWYEIKLSNMRWREICITFPCYGTDWHRKRQVKTPFCRFESCTAHHRKVLKPQRFMFIGTQYDLWGRPDGTGHEKISRGNFPRLIFSLIPSLFERHISIGCADLIWDITLDEISALCLFIGRGPFFA